jgi:NAD(P)-dependent dehydrogenase (short-subunit alcohol dehydrogenase family)
MTTRQFPIGSGFGAQTTARQALAGRDLRGKVAIVTGGYSGLGLETTRVLAEAGATVIVPARTPDKAQQALAGIPRVEQDALDLLDPASISAFAQRFVGTGRPLHMLVNNAGIMATPLVRDTRGYESQFSANHLGHFQLTAQLLPALRQAGDARVVSVSSRGHRFGGVDFDDPNFERRDYDRWKAYGQSKTANVLFALGLDARGAAHDVRAFSVHPGRIMTTDLGRHLTIDDLRAAGLVDEQGRLPADARLKTIEQGAATIVWCAASLQLEGMGGVYCEDADIAHPVAADSTEDGGVKPWAIDPDFAERLWKLSEELTGVELRF